MRPIVTDKVAWSVCLSVSLAVRRYCEPCKNGWTDRDVVLDVDLGGPKEPCVRRGGSDPACKGAVLRGKGQSIVKYRDFLQWAVQKRLSRSSCCLGCGVVHIGAIWRIQLNCACKAAMRPYVLMSNYSDHLLELQHAWEYAAESKCGQTVDKIQLTEGNRCRRASCCRRAPQLNLTAGKCRPKCKCKTIQVKTDGT